MGKKNKKKNSEVHDLWEEIQAVKLDLKQIIGEVQDIIRGVISTISAENSTKPIDGMAEVVEAAKDPGFCEDLAESAQQAHTGKINPLKVDSIIPAKEYIIEESVSYEKDSTIYILPAKNVVTDDQIRDELSQLVINTNENTVIAVRHILNKMGLKNK